MGCWVDQLIQIVSSWNEEVLGSTLVARGSSQESAWVDLVVVAVATRFSWPAVIARCQLKRCEICTCHGLKSMVVIRVRNKPVGCEAIGNAIGEAITE